MRSTRIPAAVLSLVLLVGACSNTAGEAFDPDALDPLVQDRLESALVATMEEYNVPGAVVGVSMPGRGTWVAEEGVADTSSAGSVSADSAWPLRSLTKSFTTTVLLQLVDEGKVDLDDAIDEYVPGVPNGDEITIRQLAAMSSGLADYTTNSEFIEELISDPDREFTIAELNDAGTSQEPDFAPGTDYVYSNTNTNLIGAVIEEVTGRPFADVLDQRILGPLELGSTQYIASPDEWPAPHATGYTPGDDGTVEVAPEVSFTGLGPAGAMVSTLGDVARWGAALGSGELVSAELQAQRLMMHSLSEGPEYDEYGLGIGEISGWVGHTGEGLGFTALVMHNVESGGTVVTFMNTSNAERHAPVAFFEKAAEILDAE